MRTQGGFILIAVLWVAMLLSVFALNYATTSRIGAQRAMTSEQLMTETHLLRSALAMAEHSLRKYLANQELLEQLAQSAPEEQALEAAEHLFHPRHEPYMLDLGGTQVQVRVVSASGKWNVNTIAPQVLENVLAACGVEYGTETTRVVNSILDWIDEDDLRRIEGAESPFYMALEHPYPAKNGPLESIEELLLVQGIDRHLFQGTENTPGLIDFLTVSGQDMKLDINNASPRAMALVPDIREDVIDAVMERRKAGRITKMSDMALDVDARAYEQLTQFFDVLPLARVTIEARVYDPAGDHPGRALRVELE